jgi:Tol biopolymer transport system component
VLLDRNHEVAATGPDLGVDPEALIREARRRTRRRRARSVVGPLLAGALGLVVYMLVGRGGSGVVAGSRTTPFVNLKAFAGQGDLAFVSRDRLWVVDGKTSVRELPTSGGQEALSPEFSHDHRWLAYLTESENLNKQNSYELWVARANGSGARRAARVAGLVGWSPRSDVLAVTVGDQTKYAMYGSATALDVVSTTGQRRTLVRAPAKPATPGGIDSIWDVTWSPDGSQLAVTLSGGRADTIETVPLQPGGAPTTWFSRRGSEAVHVLGLHGRVPTEVITDLAGWWSGRGIGFWVIDFGGTRDPDNTQLAVIPSPGAEPHLLAETLSTGITDTIAPEAHGQLAIVATLPSALGREFAAGKAIKTCPAGSLRCIFVPGATVWLGSCPGCGPAPRSGTPGSGVSEDPSWSPNGELLAYTKAPSFNTAAWPDDAWFADHAIYIWNYRTGTTRRVGSVDGSAVPTWSANGRDLLFESNDGLWLMGLKSGRAVRIEYPLYSQTAWNTRYSHLANISYYGQIPWTKQFSWNTP